MAESDADLDRSVLDVRRQHVAELLALLDVEQLEVNIFRGTSPDDHRQRVFGGQVAAQALVAAGRTVGDDRRVHSLHSYFLRPGDPAIPIIYDVDRIRDGRSFTTRRVIAIQHGRAIFNLAASFQADEPGYDHAMAMPDVPAPESLGPWTEDIEARIEQLPPEALAGMFRPPAIESRWVGEPHWLSGVAREATQDVWIRVIAPIPDAPLLHACVVAYASDLTLLDTVTMPHAVEHWRRGVMMASLDHAMWFHRPFRADEWLLYHQHSPSASGARGLAMGYVFRSDGALVVTVIQEGLFRAVSGETA